MDSTKSIGPYSIPIPLLKILKVHIALILSRLVNESLLCRIFPEKLKLARLLVRRHVWAAFRELR